VCLLIKPDTNHVYRSIEKSVMSINDGAENGFECYFLLKFLAYFKSNRHIFNFLYKIFDLTIEHVATHRFEILILSY